MTRDHIFVRCEDCRNHGKCKKERTAFRTNHIKGCFVEKPFKWFKFNRARRQRP